MNYMRTPTEEEDAAGQALQSDDPVRDAIADYQSFLGLPATGTIIVTFSY